MTRESNEPPRRAEDGLEDVDEIEPGDLVIELIDGVPHVHTEE